MARPWKAIPMIGKIISDHKIIAELGRGGMGVIYEADQISLSRPVAMKVLADHLGRDPAFVQRFLNEARAIAKLNHPNIVQIYNVGQEDEIYYFTMEFIDGTSLDEIISKQKMLPLEHVLNIISNVAKALAFAHEHGIVHRDIKPNNIMINKQGTVKLMDFGIALQERAQRVTITGGILGTPEYMSPEQAMGKTASTLSDIYSLGAVFYEMLTGKVPIKGDTPLETIGKIQIETPIPPRSLNQRIPPDVEKIIMKMMAKNPEQRYQSCQALRKDLKRSRASGPIMPPPKQKTPPAKPAARVKRVPPPPPRIVPARRSGIKTGLIIFLVLCLTVSLALLFKYGKKPSAPTKTSQPAAIIEPVKQVLASDAEAARLAMEQAREKAAADLVQRLVDATNLVADHPWIESARIEGPSVIVVATIERDRRGGVLRKTQRLENDLRRRFTNVKITGQELTSDGLHLNLELQTVSEFATYLASRPMVQAPPTCVQVWRRAEKMRRSGDEYFRGSQYGPAQKSYNDANELYGKTSEVATVEKSAAMVDRELRTALSKAEEFSFSDTVVLKRGKEIKGEIVSKDADSVQIHTPLGMVTLPIVQISSLMHAPPEVGEALQRLRSEIRELERQQGSFGDMLREFQVLYTGIPVAKAPGEVKQSMLSAGTFYVISFIIILLIFLLLGLSLRPTREIATMLFVLLSLGALDWFNVLNPCESPFYNQECLDYPYEHHPDIFPGLFPPLLFREGCTESQQKIINPFGWKCIPITWQVDEWNFCNTTCKVNPISWAYTALYWHALSCIITFIPKQFRRKEITL